MNPGNRISAITTEHANAEQLIQQIRGMTREFNHLKGYTA